MKPLSGLTTDSETSVIQCGTTVLVVIVHCRTRYKGDFDRHPTVTCNMEEISLEPSISTSLYLSSAGTHDEDSPGKMRMSGRPISSSDLTKATHPPSESHDHASRLCSGFRVSKPH